MNAPVMADTAQKAPFLQSVGEYISKIITDIIENLPTLFVDILICVLIWFAARFLIARITKYTAGILKGTRIPKKQQ
jgi:hypothetical protein